MTYEQMIRETDQLVRDVLHRSMIAEAVMFSMIAVLLALIVRLWWMERKARKAQKVIGGEHFSPTVTDTVQVVDGVGFHRMGVPGRRCE